MLSQKSVSDATYQFGLLEAALAHAERTDALEIPAIAIYYHCYRALDATQQNNVHFQQFRLLLTQCGDLFPPEELRDLYILAINFCIRQYNAGNQAYLAEQLELYKEGFCQKILPLRWLYFSLHLPECRYHRPGNARIGMGGALRP